MPSRGDIVGQREQWITDICAGLVGAFEEHPALDPAGIPPELGDLITVRALLVSRIAALVAGGRSSGDIAGLLEASGVFVKRKPEPGQLMDLVNEICHGLQFRGITESITLPGLGLRVWNPESTFLLLVELWSQRRLGSVTDSRLRREIKQLWGIDDTLWLTAIRSRQPGLLREFPDLWAELQAEPDVLVRNAAALAVGSRSSTQAWEQWEEQTPFSSLHAEHLATLGGDLVQATRARRILRRLHQPDPELRRAAARALEIIEDQLGRMDTALGGLSALERELIRPRSEEHRFQETCLDAIIEWSFDRTDRYWSVDEADTVHGMWGPLPWWSVTVRDDAQERAAVATLTEGALPLGLEHVTGEPSRLRLICRRPRTSAPGLRALFTFDLTNPAHAGELLLIGRRGTVCVDLLRATGDEDDPGQQDLGTLCVTAGRELARLLTELATTALRELLPDDWQAHLDDLGRLPSLRESLRRVSRHDGNEWSAVRRLTATTTRGAGGRIALETGDPPTTVAQFAKAARQRVAARGNGTQLPLFTSHEIGFVYVSRNAAIPGMLKIGFSQKLSEDRAEELSSTSVPFRFEVRYRRLTSRAREVEQAVHRLLAAHRVDPTREFFRINQADAEEAIVYCQELVTGIDGWEPMPILHQLHAGDRISLPLKAGQIFVVAAYPHPMAESAEIVDIWQSHADGDVLELYVTRDQDGVNGFSDGDPYGVEDPVPHLNRDDTAPNGILAGRERLMPGDRLAWLSYQGGTDLCRNVVFEIDDFCQVTYRTWNPSTSPDGFPLLLNYVTRPLPSLVAEAVRDVLELNSPRSWAPRNPDPFSEFDRPERRRGEAETWLPQLRHRHRR